MIWECEPIFRREEKYYAEFSCYILYYHPKNYLEILRVFMRERFSQGRWLPVADIEWMYRGGVKWFERAARPNQNASPALKLRWRPENWIFLFRKILLHFRNRDTLAFSCDFFMSLFLSFIQHTYFQIRWEISVKIQWLTRALAGPHQKQWEAAAVLR